MITDDVPVRRPADCDYSGAFVIIFDGGFIEIDRMCAGDAAVLSYFPAGHEICFGSFRGPCGGCGSSGSLGAGVGIGCGFA